MKYDWYDNNVILEFKAINNIPSNIYHVFEENSQYSLKILQPIFR